MTDLVIRIRGLRRDYDMGSEVVHALRGVDLDIARNEYVAIMGPSGSGKSTLMNLIGCLDTPSGGEYWLNGHEVSRMSDDALARVRNREIGFVFQTFNLLPRATALQNVELPLVYAGVSTRERHARALVNDPSIVLADEPTGNLDSATSSEIMGVFDQLHRAGQTILLITHEHDIAAHAHRQIHLKDGMIELDEITRKTA